MIRAGIIGLGKMGISHYAIVNAHPDVNVVAVCDVSKFILGGLKKYADIQCFSHYRKMIDRCKPDCVIIATPTSSHAEILRCALERDMHVFVEKPFCLRLEDGWEMVKLAKQHKVVNQVGYHNRFVAVFNETKRLLEQGAIGKVYHFTAETYGPVVLKSKGLTWRAKRSEGGGCLYDYASHAIDLINYLVGRPDKVSGTIFRKIYSRDVEDAVYATLLYENGQSGQLAVNWSDETYRKITVQITIFGIGGKIIADRQECRVYLRDKAGFDDLTAGWNVKNITELTKPLGFYLRGEEYSAQLDYFIECVKQGRTDNINSFSSALQTDTVINLLLKDSEGGG